MRAIFVLPAAVLALSGCGLDRIDITVSSSTTVPGSPLGGTLDLAQFGDFASFDLGQSQEFQNEDVSKDDIDSAKLRSMRMAVYEGQGDSFEQWLDSISFYVEAGGLPRRLVAHREGIRDLPAGTRTIDLVVEGVELRPYVTAPSMTLSAEATGQPPSVDTTVDATAVVEVDVNVSPF